MSEQKRESMKQIEDDILADLLELEDQMSQYTFLVECGLELPEYPAALKTDEYLIHECQVNTWMHLEWIDDCLNWQGISDSLVICGVKTLKLDIPLVPETRIKWAFMPLHIAKIYILKLCLDEEIIPRCRFPCSSGYLTKCINQQKKQ